ncbi:MAG: cyclic nucleotide-binding domain-containing protein [Archangium sp.]|nr:cyclic nucleotide-binding domain-containing protein [Archangium sp.]
MAVAGSLLGRFASSSLCRGLTETEVESLFGLCEVRRLPAGATVFREGEAADALWVLLDGDVEIACGGNVLAEVGPGAALGELSLFRAVPRRSATVTAICKVTVLRISGPQFQKRLLAWDLAALKVVNNLAHQMADRLAALNEKLLSGGRKGLAVARGELRRVVG